MFLPPKQENTAAFAATQLQVATQQLRNKGIGFNRSRYPVDKAHTPHEVWDRREDMYPPQYTGRVGYSPTNQWNPQYNCGFQAGLDDSSEGESPSPPPPLSPPSSSEDSSLSDNNWIGAFAPNVEFLDKKERIENNTALKNFYLMSKTSVEEPDNFGYKSDVKWHTQKEIVGHHWDGDNLMFHTEWNTDEGVGDPGKEL
ncbi:hypothetical protein BT96DRAFT_997598 [Gymnopus androsaceus JB14]|uniref:Uncharacterized protein n=1 Tax=Gymnopus androsaceus JB14 TaxID=1447944 RepID=A0A6A4HCW6_9AGAR|nr:hypothetical protein BT96DRAFT_997598 [Gymnopus androsaceus JB14]